MAFTLRSLVAVTAGAVLAPMAMVLAAAPAHAGSGCTDSQHKSISTPGYNTDLYVKVCSTGGTYRKHGAYLIVSWHDGGNSANDGDRKFDGLRFHLRVERYNTDYVKDSWSLAGLVNRNESGTWSSPILYAYSSKRGGWSGDGYVRYDVDRDGRGYLERWRLHGSPLAY